MTHLQLHLKFQLQLVQFQLQLVLKLLRHLISQFVNCSLKLITHYLLHLFILILLSFFLFFLCIFPNLSLFSYYYSNLFFTKIKKKYNTLSYNYLFSLGVIPSISNSRSSRIKLVFSSEVSSQSLSYSLFSK